MSKKKRHVASAVGVPTRDGVVQQRVVIDGDVFSKARKLGEFLEEVASASRLAVRPPTIGTEDLLKTVTAILLELAQVVENLASMQTTMMVCVGHPLRDAIRLRRDGIDKEAEAWAAIELAGSNMLAVMTGEPCLTAIEAADGTGELAYSFDPQAFITATAAAINERAAAAAAGPMPGHPDDCSCPHCESGADSPIITG